MKNTIIKGFAGIFMIISALLFLAGWIPFVVLAIHFQNGFYLFGILGWLATCPVTYAIVQELSTIIDNGKEQSK